MRKSLLLCLVWLACYAGGAATIAFAQGPTTKTVYKDYDRDGFGDPTKPKSTNNPIQGYVDNNLDCNDLNKRINPNATEVKDGKDNDCDGMVDESVFYQDNDGDGFGSSVAKQALSRPGGYAARSGDCDDTYDKTFPGAAETCDGRDNDCDAGVDEGVKTTFYADADGDGYGNKDVTTQACSAPDGYVATGSDTDDGEKNTYPGAPEICDGKDNNNNGQTDEGVTTPYYKDGDGDGFGNSGDAVQACQKPAGYVGTGGDADDSDMSVYPGAAEICDYKDNDQDGQTDEGVKTLFYADTDGDGFGNPNASLQACSAPAGYVANKTDADDTDRTIYPNAPELCDNKDNDGDSSVDEGLTINTYHLDADGDGFGASTSSGVAACDISVLPAPPVGSKWSTNKDDWNDGDKNFYPGAPELCDGRDNDGDGRSDEDLPTVAYYLDADGDGWGPQSTERRECNINQLPAAPAGSVWVQHSPSFYYDENDNDRTIAPFEPERCDGKDNNQNGVIDEGVKTTYYRDNDGDGWGTEETTLSCNQPNGYANRPGDFNDVFASVYPGAPEICDGRDNDGDHAIDEGLTFTKYCLDWDGDGWGTRRGEYNVCNVNQLPPAPAGSVWVQNRLDFLYDDNDADDTIYPGAPELCDGKDNNQNGTVDENCPTPGARMGASAGADQVQRPVSTLYPNPAVDGLTISLSRPVSKLKSVKVNALIDQTVLVNDYTVVESDKIRMRVSQLKPGLYIIRIDFGDGYETLKFIKN